MEREGTAEGEIECADMDACVRACVRGWVGACVRAWVRAWVGVCVGACVRVWVRGCVRVFVYGTISHIWCGTKSFITFNTISIGVS